MNEGRIPKKGFDRVYKRKMLKRKIKIKVGKQVRKDVMQKEEEPWEETQKRMTFDKTETVDGAISPLFHTSHGMVLN
jgi:hypothetical protein